jgi:hypothetical protein
VNVSVEGRLYTVNGSATIRIPSGYFNATELTLQFNDTKQEGNGVIIYYTFKNTTYNGETYATYSAIPFAFPNMSKTLYINYVNKY